MIKQMNKSHRLTLKERLERDLETRISWWLGAGFLWEINHQATTQIAIAVPTSPQHLAPLLHNNQQPIQTQTNKFHTHSGDTWDLHIVKRGHNRSPLRHVHWKVLLENQNGSYSITEKNLLETLFFKKCTVLFYAKMLYYKTFWSSYTIGIY